MSFQNRISLLNQSINSCFSRIICLNIWNQITHSLELKNLITSNTVKAVRFFFTISEESLSKDINIVCLWKFSNFSFWSALGIFFARFYNFNPLSLLLADQKWHIFTCGPAVQQGVASMTTLIKMTIWWCPNASPLMTLPLAVQVLKLLSHVFSLFFYK